MFTTETSVEETRFPGALARGARGKAVGRVQEWLSLHDHQTSVDGVFGPATERALARFQSDNGMVGTGALDAATWSKLVQPMVSALAATTTARTLGEAVLDIGEAHVAQRPLEVGGDNRGPWVRLYMNGNDGPEWRWCAGFVSFLLEQACSATQLPMPIAPSFSCTALGQQAGTAGRLQPGTALLAGDLTWQSMGPASIFLCRSAHGDGWSHTGIAYEGSGATFLTLEGNTNDGGSANGYEVCCRTRSVDGKDFIRI